MTRVSQFRSWFNHVIDVRRKAVAYLIFVLFMLSVGFQYQTNALNNARVKDVEAQQERSCQIKIETREQVRTILLSIVDLSDVLPDSHLAAQYTEARTAQINDLYPTITEADC